MSRSPFLNAVGFGYQSSVLAGPFAWSPASGLSGLAMNPAGNITVGAPSSGIAVAALGASAGGSSTTTIDQYKAVNAVAGTYAIQFAASNSTAATYAFTIDGSGAPGLSLYRTDVLLPIVKFGISGNVTLQTPSGGVSLTVNSVAGGVPLTMTDGTVTAVGTFSGTQYGFGTTSNHPVGIIANGVYRLQISTAGDITARGVALCKFKSTDSTSTSTTPTADTDLQVALAANATYEIECYLQFGGDATSITHGLNAAFYYSGTQNVLSAYSWVGCLNASSTAVTRGTANNVTSGSSISNVVTNGSIILGTTDFILIKGKLSTATAGTLGINWCQNNTGTGTTTIYRSSYMKITLMS